MAEQGQENADQTDEAPDPFGRFRIERVKGLLNHDPYNRDYQESRQHDDDAREYLFLVLRFGRFLWPIVILSVRLLSIVVLTMSWLGFRCKRQVATFAFAGGSKIHETTFRALSAVHRFASSCG